MSVAKSVQKGKKFDVGIILRNLYLDGMITQKDMETALKQPANKAGADVHPLVLIAEKRLSRADSPHEMLTSASIP